MIAVRRYNLSMKKIIFLLFIFISLFFAFLSPAFAKEPQKIVILPKNEVVNHDYFGFGDRVEVNGTVNGDAYVAGGVVIVNGKINGDLLTAGGNVTVSGTVSGDLRAAGGNVTISGADIGGSVTLGSGNANIDSSTKIGKSIVAGGGNLQIFAPVARGATLGAGSILIANSIGSSVKAATRDLNLSSNAKIKGDLTYWSENDVNLSDGASVSGAITKELPKHRELNKNDRQFGKDLAAAAVGLFIAVKLLDLFWLTIFGVVLVLLFPNFSIRTADYATKKLGWALLFGFLALILLPVVGVILFLTVIGIPLALILFFIFIFIFWIGRVFAIYALGRATLGILSDKNRSKAVGYLLGMLIYLVLAFIPLVGPIMNLVVSLAGVGALLATKKEIYSSLRKDNIL